VQAAMLEVMLYVDNYAERVECSYPDLANGAIRMTCFHATTFPDFLAS